MSLQQSAPDHPQQTPDAPSRILHLPAEGRLLVCTDLHGNLRDFERIAELFDKALAAGDDPFLLLTGDLIHGPNAEEHEWPPYLGTFYRDHSGDLMDAYLDLLQQHPTRVACLLGNHEHSHVGGPHTPKFWTDETAHFERTVGARRTERYREAFRNFPLVAIARCGVAICHAAPNVKIASLGDLEGSYEGYEFLDIHSMYSGPPLCRLLWCRHCPSQVARSFLDVLGHSGYDLNVVVFGHDIVAEGFRALGDEQLQLSTSFGVNDECKFYLDLDLGGRYCSTADLTLGREIKRLYPEA